MSKSKKTELAVVPLEAIVSKIFLIRGKKVMLDKDLAELYGVVTGNFNKSVKRNASRFPQDFMFQLTSEELENLIFQIGISSSKWGGRRHLPYVFTEQGVAMLSSILQSERAVQMNIQIIRTFTKLREIILENKELSEKIKNMESKYDKHIGDIFEVLKGLVTEKLKPKGKIGFNTTKS